MTYLNSSVIREIGVKDDDLLVVFKGGATYSYAQGSVEYSKLLAADSAGIYFATNIRGKYNYNYLGINTIQHD